MIKTCIDCGSEFEAHTSAKRCITCQEEFKKINKRRIALECAYKSGRIKEPGVGSGNSTVNKNRPLGKQTYRRALGTCCSMCGKTREEDYNHHEWCVHHVDRNRSNNDPSNLVTMCKSCHQKIHDAAAHLNCASKETERMTENETN